MAYRLENIEKNVPVRGLTENDSHRCGLMTDDSMVAGDWHFPCIIHFREGGEPVGRVGPNMRQERIDWLNSHDTHKDPICKANCLDVCVAYNNKFERENDQSTHYHKMFYKIARSSNFLSIYNSFIREIVKPTFGEDVVYQKIPTFRLHFPGNIGVGEYHGD